MRHLLLPAFLFLTILPACSSIPYPATSAGNTLRNFYTGHGATADEAVSALSDEKQVTPADRTALTPVILTILRHDHSSERALFLAWILSDWNHELSSTAPEFRTLIPGLIRKLDAPQYEEEDIQANKPSRWSAVQSALLLGCIGPDPIFPYRQAIARRYNTPTTKPIEPESNECWTRTALAGLLIAYANDGIPTIVEGLHHQDSLVRCLSLEALGAAADPDNQSFPTMCVITRVQRLAAGQAVANVLPQILASLHDADPSVQSSAIHALPHFANSPAAISQIIAALTSLQNSDPAYSIRDTLRYTLEHLPPPTTAPATNPRP